MPHLHFLPSHPRSRVVRSPPRCTEVDLHLRPPLTASLIRPPAYNNQASSDDKHYAKRQKFCLARDDSQQTSPDEQQAHGQKRAHGSASLARDGRRSGGRGGAREGADRAEDVAAPRAEDVAAACVLRGDGAGAHTRGVPRQFS
eukprot:1195152-Prorocentrum_minimum.AAC.2